MKVSQTEFKPSELSFGGGALSGAYDAIADHWPVEACREALLSGINTFDTSPYYGKSEYILGDALEQIKDEFPRSTYYLETKVGRYGYTPKDFDYSTQRTLESVAESMKRLKTDYIDVVLCHDVEFVEFDQVVGENGALKALFQLKTEGKIKYVGCSGYPLPILLKIAQHQNEKGQPLDVILSYSHYNLQNTSLADYASLFRQAGVRYILNASPLNMALFREAGPPEWHPAHSELRQAAQQCAQVAKDNGLNISTLASMFAFSGRSAFQLDSTVIGLEKKEEVQQAVAAWKVVKAREEGSIQVPDIETKVLDQINSLLEPYKNYSWQSPTPKELGL
ncbi:NADP-dependent oxidoreductase domain-containing protein, partial [Halteromyces radiatus]|uniref:NADP-dependent oxidoreductase domain-containing protein n=1 Tax=Halteromyces radiatus TaxID=101107 RepID=UPI00221F4843